MQKKESNQRSSAAMATAVALTVATEDQQRKDLTVQSSVREPIDNAMATTANMTDRDPAVAVHTDLHVIVDSKGKQHSLYSNMSLTNISGENYGSLCKIMGPKKHDGPSSITSMQGRGMHNTYLGICGENNRECMALLCAPAQTGDGFYYNITMQSLGLTPNDKFFKEKGFHSRASITGNLLIAHKDELSGSSGYTLSLQRTDEGAPHPGPRPTRQEFQDEDLLSKLADETKRYVLKNSPFYIDKAANEDAGDQMITFTEDCINKLASHSRRRDESGAFTESTGAAITRVRKHPLLFILCWEHRSELKKEDGVVFLNNKAAHLSFANTYMHPDAASRALLKSHGVPQAQPRKLEVFFGDHKVDWDKNLVFQEQRDGKLVPYEDSVHGLGPMKNIIDKPQLIIESFVVPLGMVTSTDPARVAVYLQSSLAVADGDFEAFSKGTLFAEADALRDCGTKRRDLQEYLRIRTLKDYAMHGADIEPKIKGSYPDGYAPPEGLFAKIVVIRNQLYKELQRIAKLPEATLKQNHEEAELKLKAYENDPLPEYYAHKIRLHIEEGAHNGTPGTKWLYQQFKVVLMGMVGVGHLHQVTLRGDNPHVNAAKSSLLGDTEASKAVQAAVMDRNLEITAARGEKLLSMLGTTLEQSRTQQRRDQVAEREKTQQKERDHSRMEAQRRAQAQKEAAEKVQRDLEARMLALGVLPTKGKKAGTVQFVKGDARALNGTMKAIAEVEPALRRGKLRLDGVLFGFKGAWLAGSSAPGTAPSWMCAKDPCVADTDGPTCCACASVRLRFFIPAINSSALSTPSAPVASRHACASASERMSPFASTGTLSASLMALMYGLRGG